MDHADEQALLAGTKVGVSDDAALCTMDAANTDLQDASGNRPATARSPAAHRGTKMH